MRGTLISGFNFTRWLESEPHDSHTEHVVIHGQNFLLEITPVHLDGEDNQPLLVGAVVMLRSTVRMGVSCKTSPAAISALLTRLSPSARKCAMWLSRPANCRC
ncbi:Transcriptional regulatory protein tyrR [Cedecea neteri]|uniref:Transcriptional regulatory protein tyrR n=1 Tax=Cedecea neteri TaxID=158822 RepID=A0A2X3J0N4_9ENTR|nr:Transcriptional regulatory protein tyrR [Cedecea neteri]